MWANKTKALVISKRLKFPQDDRADTNFMVLLNRMHFSRSKGTLESLESVFKVFQGAPEKSQNFELNRLLIRKASSFASKTQTLLSD